MNAPIFYYDLVSPYSCLAAFRIEKVMPVPAIWAPVWAAPVIAASGRELPSFEQGKLRRADIVSRASRYGMPDWRWPPGYEPANEEEHARWQAPNSLAVMRLATFADQSGVGDDFARCIFHLAFGEGTDISVIGDTVLGVAADCGLDIDEARTAPTRLDIKQRLRSVTDGAIESGVIGVPTIVVGGQSFWGDDRLEEAAAASVA